MAFRTLYVVCGFVAGVAFATMVAASRADDVEAAVIEAAQQAHVDVTDLQGAMISTGQGDPFVYLRSVGELPPLTPPPSPYDARLRCILRYESNGDPSATNRSSKAAGLFQFLWSTWNGTPQGRAGLSPYDPDAAWAAARWMLNQGRAREWVPVQRGLC